MCILCVASRWSRRIVTFLPWLIIPLIILWGLSQLLPSEFQFEVTSPRLACVGVLLFSLGWYELAMPRLTTWRAKRSAYLKERRRLEVQEAVKWRKEAIRLCRNCSSPYRDQTPACGKFVCTFCGHMSRRPVLDLPPSTVNAASVKAITVASAQSPPCGRYTCDTKGDHSLDTRGVSWVCRILPKCMKFSVFGASLAWMVGRRAPRCPSSSIRASYVFPLCSQWGAEHANGNLSGWFGKENCRGDFSIFFFVFRVFCIILICLKWLGQKACGGDTGGEETLAGGRRGEEHKEDDADNRKGSRSEKARRKAEEKRLARLARVQLEADERRQREEVARLVEEQRRLRDEKVEAERVNERETAAEKDKELRQEGEAERRRQEKLKRREISKDRLGMRDAGEHSEKDRKKGDCKVKVTQDQNSIYGGKRLDATRTIPTAKESNKPSIKPVKSDLCVRSTDTKMAVSLKAGRYSRNSKMQNAISPPTWDYSSVTAANLAKVSGSIGSAIVKDTETLCTNEMAPCAQHLNTGYSAWKNMRWSNVWGKAAPTTPSEVCPNSPALPSNFDLQRAACSDFLDTVDWFAGVHARGDTQRELNYFSDLDQEADMIIGVDHINYVAPIGPHQAIHAENFGTHSAKHASTMTSEPWADDSNTRGLSNLDLAVLGGEAATEDGNWKMWEAPQLDQIQLPCIKDSSADPFSWILPLGLSSEVANPNSMGVSAQRETQLSNGYSSSQPDYSHPSCPVSLPTMSTSLWSNPSFFSSTNLKRSAGVVSHITQEMMDEPITLADDIFYEHFPTLAELQTCNTSLNSGQYFAPIPDTEVGMDRPLQSDQSMTGVQQRSAMHRETLELQDSRSKWSVGIVSGDWSTLGPANTKSSNTHYGGVYSAPSASSLWSINAT